MALAEFRGTARLDRRTKRLVKRLGPDDIAIIDHAELDRVSAEELVESGVRVVVNVAPSVSNRFPNPGPLELVRSGLTTAWALKKLFGNQFQIDKVNNLLVSVQTLNRLTGTDDPAKLPETWRDDVATFERIRKQYLVYR